MYSLFIFNYQEVSILKGSLIKYYFNLAFIVVIYNFGTVHFISCVVVTNEDDKSKEMLR